jgi:phospholipase D1/2
VAVLKDAAGYFAALRAALLLAERQVYIIGWDIHSETLLVGPGGRPDDGLPAALAPFLSALLERKQNLQINILAWDFAVLYAHEREWNSARKFLSGGSGRIRFCMDSKVPLGSAQHQKIVAIDGAIAFVGGLDLTIRRWDTPEHEFDHPFRKDPEGRPYRPFHDVQCMVDGEAARNLWQLAERRWQNAGCAVRPIQAVNGERWPAAIPAQCRNIPAGIARTEVATSGLPAVDEVYALFRASIEAARNFIYIENQFTSSTEIANALASRMRAVPTLQALIITPRAHTSWLESQTMQSGREGFLGPLNGDGLRSRLRILYPSVGEGDASCPVMVHSKVMIVDDELLRIGSSNLNNRSMGADSECDLVFEAADEDHREFIRGVRRQLIAHHCGVTEEEIAAREGNLFPFIDRLAEAGARKALRPVRLQSPPRVITDIVQPIADPKEPLHLERAANMFWTGKTALAVVGIVAALAGLALAWRYTSLRAFADPGFLSSLLGRYSHSALGPILAILAFILGELVLFPVVVLIAATAAALGPWTGFVTAAVGVLSSASLCFFIGRVLGHKRLESLLGERALHLEKRIVGKGVLAVAMIRMVPVAPFSVINVLAGASRLSFFDFLLGTALGMAPGLVAMAVLGSQIADFARNASWSNALLLGLTISGWILLCLLVQFVVTWLTGRRT